MSSIRNDFSKFLTEIGYSQSTAYNYAHYLNKFAKENEYADLIALADDVFILLDRGIHSNRDFNHKTLAAIKKNKSLLTLFNSFLFDVNFKRDFVIPCSSSTAYLGVLMTDQPYISGKQPRTLIDKDTSGPTNKQYFDMREVMSALHVDEKTLKRWDNKDKEGKLAPYFPHRYKDNPKGDIDLSTNNTLTGIYRFYYYRLDELNKFLEYQFYYGSGIKREQYLRDGDIRISKKRKK